MASTYLTRTITTNNPTGRKTMTLSVWLKRATASATNMIFATGTGSERDMILFESDGKLQFSRYDSSYIYQLKTNRQFRDTSAWYHFVFVYDSTQSTSSDRLKIYVNGVQETSFATASYPSQDYQSNYSQSTYTQTLGRDTDGNFPFDGCMSHVNYIDGTALTPSTFGSTDSTTGEWKINTSPSVTYGTNGFFLLKDDNSNLDRGGSNNFTINGTLTKTEDNPSNNFATLNAVSFHEANFSLSNGANTMATGNNTAWNNAICSTLVATGGKFYWEAKWTDGDSYSIIGIIEAKEIHRCATSVTGGGSDIYFVANAIQTDNGGGSPQRYRLVNSDDNISISAPPGCIMQFALDCENRKFWFGVNGTFYNSGNPATGANPTWDTTDIPANGEFVPYAQGYKISGATAFQFNFGNGYFGTTAVSSAGTNASNNGIFEYDVPSGFTALSTKGLNL